MRVVLVGAVESSGAALRSLSENGTPPVLVVTLPSEYGHRHSDFVHLGDIAQASGIGVCYTRDINAPATLAAIAAIKPDLCLVIGWSQICKEPLRSIAPLGTIGFHPSALPRLRGRGVIPWTILLGEVTTGSTLFWLGGLLDAGDILLQRTFSVQSDETAKSLYVKHTTALAEMLPEALSLVQRGSPPRIMQNESQATYCAKRTPDDGLIDWKDSASSILRLVRAVGDPYPGAFSFQDGEQLTIHEASPFPDSSRFIGVPGQVQCHTERGFAVRCGDGECIDVRVWRWKPLGPPKVHTKFGTPCANFGNAKKTY